MFRGSLVSKISLFLFFLLIIASQTEAFRTLVGFWKDKDGPCPSGYALVPSGTYTSYDFCVAKYEMKNIDGYAIPIANDDVWTEVTHEEAVHLCRVLGPGYDLINNKEWQTIARNIADTPVNWSSGTAYSGELNRGHSDGTPAGTLIASSNDNQACSGTGQSCSSTVWSSQRRTSVLSNGEFIWDFAGNATEWILDDNSAAQGADGYAASFNTSDARQIFFGNDQFCASPAVSPYCGFGQGIVNSAAGGILRGGANGDDIDVGVFASNLSYAQTTAQNWIGFRCVYHRPKESEPCEGAASGTLCSGGSKYAGQLSGTDYMVTPGACTDSVTPQCSGATDALTKAWGATGVAHPNNLNDGETNTATLSTNWTNTQAARYCAALIYGGYDDWFLPATNELNLLFTNRALIGGFAAGKYWTSTQSTNNLTSAQSFTTGTVTADTKTLANSVRCVRKMKPVFQAQPPEVTKLNVAFPTTTSAWKTVTITNIGQKAAVSVSTAISTGFSIGSNGCAGQPLPVGSSCTLQVRASGVNLDGPKSGTLTISEGSVSTLVPLSGIATGFPDPCLTATTIGTLCEGGPFYAGTFNYGGSIGSRKLMVTPGGCTDASSPICLGGTDSVAKTWGTAVDHTTVSTTDGQANTETLASGWTDTNAALYCANMVYGGYDDWYLPAELELAQLYTNRVVLGGFAAAVYWSSTQATNANARSQNFSTGAWAGTAKTTATPRVRCVRRFAGLEVNPTQTTLNIIAPATSSNLRTITVNNTGSAPTATLSTSISGALLTIVSGTDTCQGTILAAGDSCSFQIQAVGAIWDGPITGTATVTDGALSATVSISGTISGVADPCSYSPPAGTTCWGGARFAGQFGGSDLMVVPGGCTNSATPTCAGGSDTVTKAWGANTTEHNVKSTTDGIGNTTLLVAGWSDTNAAKYCDNMVYGGYDDWYLPAKDELNHLYSVAGPVGGFASAKYWSSTESSASMFFIWSAFHQNMGGGGSGETTKDTGLRVRCIRKGSDFVPAPIDWVDFSATSSVQAFSSISVINLEISTVTGTGSPIVWYRKNGGAWTQFSPGAPATPTAVAGGTFAFMVSGTAGSTATITIKNLSDGGNVLDTVVGTSPADCSGNWYGGACWYLSPSGSCTSLCSTHGGYSSATRTIVGDQGTNAACGAVLAGLGSPDLGPATSSSGCEDGAQYRGCHIISLSGNYRCTNGATSAGQSGNRACACNN